jgi:hypothetical protein
LTVVAAADVDGLEVAVFVEAFHRIGQRNHRVEDHSELDRHTVADASLNAATVVGESQVSALGRQKQPLSVPSPRRG